MDVKLIMFRGNGSRRVFPLPPGATTIGRKTDCNIRIPVGEVSRRHAEVVVETNSVVLRDLGASNGTFLNDRKITEEDLEPGDRISIGPVNFTVQIDGDPPDEELQAVGTKTAASQEAGGGGGVNTSRHVVMSDEEVDPIAALEALASSADQTAINPEDDD